MDLKLPKMLCKDSKQHHVMFHELNSVSSLLCIAQNVRFEIPYKVLYFETPFLMIFNIMLGLPMLIPFDVWFVYRCARFIKKVHWGILICSPIASLTAILCFY